MILNIWKTEKQRKVRPLSGQWKALSPEIGEGREELASPSGGGTGKRFLCNHICKAPFAM